MWADVKKHNMSNVVVRNGGGWKPSLLNDANIVHAVKKCYKLKIDSRDLKSRFYDVIRACHHIFKQKRATFSKKCSPFAHLLIAHFSCRQA